MGEMGVKGPGGGGGGGKAEEGGKGEGAKKPEDVKEEDWEGMDDEMKKKLLEDAKNEIQ